MLPENQDNITKEHDDLPVVLDEIWVVARMIALMYFVEFQYGTEASTAIEQMASSMETTLRNAEGNVQ